VTSHHPAAQVRAYSTSTGRPLAASAFLRAPAAGEDKGRGHEQDEWESARASKYHLHVTRYHHDQNSLRIA
jgi:hypothetical protein